MTIECAKGYVAGECGWRYPKAGDARPPDGVKVLLLTEGGICITGFWKLVDETAGYILAWSPMPKRDREKEALL